MSACKFDIIRGEFTSSNAAQLYFKYNLIIITENITDDLVIVPAMMRLQVDVSGLRR